MTKKLTTSINFSFDHIWPKTTGVNWNSVSSTIEGRDWLVSTKMDVLPICSCSFRGSILCVTTSRAVVTGRSNWRRTSTSSFRSSNPGLSCIQCFARFKRRDTVSDCARDILVQGLYNNGNGLAVVIYSSSMGCSSSSIRINLT
jgi:hypothetical protein